MLTELLLLSLFCSVSAAGDRDPEDNEQDEILEKYKDYSGDKKNSVPADFLMTGPPPRPANCHYCKVEGDIWVYDAKTQRNNKDRAYKFGKRSLSDDELSLNNDVVANKRSLQDDIIANKQSSEEKRDGGVGHSMKIDQVEHLVWTTPFIPYIFDPSANSRIISAMKQAFEDFETWTCIRFVKRTIEPDYVNVTSQNEGCWSELGRVGGEQEISLGQHCNTKGSALHELMHTLGFLHEHTRLIRDEAIKIVVENIKPRKLDNFEKYPHYLTDKYNFPYDYDSIMNFRSCAFSADGNATIVPKDPTVQMARLGQRTRLSDQDIKLINLVYKCTSENAGLANEAGMVTPAQEGVAVPSELTDAPPVNSQPPPAAQAPQAAVAQQPGEMEPSKPAAPELSTSELPGLTTNLEELNKNVQDQPSVSLPETSSQNKESAATEEEGKDSYEALNIQKSVQPPDVTKLEKKRKAKAAPRPVVPLLQTIAPPKSKFKPTHAQGKNVKHRKHQFMIGS